MVLGEGPAGAGRGSELLGIRVWLEVTIGLAGSRAFSTTVDSSDTRLAPARALIKLSESSGGKPDVREGKLMDPGVWAKLGLLLGSA